MIHVNIKGRNEKKLQNLLHKFLEKQKDVMEAESEIK